MRDLIQEFKVELKSETCNELDTMMKPIMEKQELLDQDIASKCLSHDIKPHISR
jgi:hypothetical protein